MMNENPPGESGTRVPGPAALPTAPRKARRLVLPPASLLADVGAAIGPCPNCGAPMNAIRGSKAAVCGNCGFKDSCCF